MRTRQLLASGVVTALAAGLLGWAATPASAAAVIDPERYSANPTGFGWWFSASRATINDWADEHNMRITGIEVNGPDDFTAVAVHNSGVYQRAVSGSASWTVDETAESLGSKLADKRLLGGSPAVRSGTLPCYRTGVARSGETRCSPGFAARQVAESSRTRPGGGTT